MAKLVNVVKDLLWINIDTNGVAAILSFMVPYGDTTYIKATMDDMKKAGVDGETVGWVFWD